MRLGNQLALKTVLWYSSEIIDDADLNFLSRSQYQTVTDLLALIVPQRSGDVVVSGIELLWSAALTSVLKAGVALSFAGSYYDNDAWGFNAAVGDIFAVIVPVDTNVVVAAGGASDRYDTVQIRPVRTAYYPQARYFRDPVTGGISTTVVNVKVEYGSEVAVLAGTPGAGVAPAKTAGWIKVAEVRVPAGASAIDQAKIKYYNESATWTTEASATALWKVAQASLADLATQATQAYYAP